MFNSRFFFSDKDASTIQAVKNVMFGFSRLRLCIWHMLRSIEEKLASRTLANPAYTAEDARTASSLLGFEVSETFLPCNVPRTGN